MRQIAIFGAKSMALGTCRAIQTLYPEYQIVGFLVSVMHGNSPTLAGLPVMELDSFDDKEICILVATPEDTHAEIIKLLKKNNFHYYICMDSKKESYLMEQYYKNTNRFHGLNDRMVSLRVYVAKFHKDKPLCNQYTMPDWTIPIQAGADLAEVRLEGLQDNMGENISAQNANYCELTVLYWIWKNRLTQENRNDYYGLFHYRRLLQIKDTDICRFTEMDVDAVLPYPTLHEPDISEHHARYMKESDWEAMLSALEELQPEYAKVFPEILAQPCFYNYNILIAKADVLENYCAWLFPVLKRTEELSSPKGWERADRYIGYLGENLMTLYFMYHQKDLNIYHVSPLMLT